MRARLGAERQVQHSNLVLRLVRNYPIDGADHVGVGSLAVFVECLDGDKVCPRRDAVVEAVRRHQAGDRNTGYVRTMATRVATAERATGHRVGHGIVDRFKSLVSEMVVPDTGVFPQTRIEHRDADTRPVDTL